jgi:fructokinase
MLESFWKKNQNLLPFNPFIKISEDDMLRLLRRATHEEIFQFFHDQGVDIVCLFTLGVKLSQKEKILFKCQQLKLIK